MADSYIQLPPQSTGEKMDTEEITVGANDVHRERIQVAGAGDTDIAAVDATNGLDVDVTRSALPTGAATSAKQDTAAAILTTIDTDTGTIAGAVSGTEMQVDVVAALPAGNNNIGDVDIASIAAGDNNIGNVDVASLPGTVATDITAIKTATEVIDNAISGSEMQVDVVAALPAGDNNIGNVDIASAIPAGSNNIGDVDVASVATGQGKTLQFAVVSENTAADNAIVAAAGAGLKIKVVSYVLVASAAVSVTWKSATTALTGAMALAANGGISAVGQPSAHLFQTADNEALNLTNSGAVQVSGHITYFVEA